MVGSPVRRVDDRPVALLRGAVARPCAATGVGCSMIEDLNEGAAVIVLSGDYDAHNADDITARILDVLATGPSGISVDMAAVTFVDSTALTAMVRGWRECGAVGVGLAVANPSRQVRTLCDWACRGGRG